jgi:hypothetical protein
MEKVFYEETALSGRTANCKIVITFIGLVDKESLSTGQKLDKASLR